MVFNGYEREICGWQLEDIIPLTYNQRTGPMRRWSFDEQDAIANSSDLPYMTVDMDTMDAPESFTASRRRLRALSYMIVDMDTVDVPESFTATRQRLQAWRKDVKHERIMGVLWHTQRVLKVIKYLLIGLLCFVLIVIGIPLYLLRFLSPWRIKVLIGKLEAKIWRGN